MSLMLGLLSHFFFPLIFFICIIMILEIDLSEGIDGFNRSIVKMVEKHFPGFIILLFYYLYDFAWAEYHAGHYPIATVKEFRLFTLMDRHSNFIATIAIFCILYSGVFLWLNKVWFNRK